MDLRAFIHISVLIATVGIMAGTAVSARDLVELSLVPDTKEAGIYPVGSSLRVYNSNSQDTGLQEPLKTKTNASAQDFRIEEGEEFATLRDDVFFTTSNVEDLVPDSARSTFSAGEKVYVFAALRTPRDERVRFTWYAPDGKEILPSAYFDVEPNLGAVGFRIFSYRTFRKPGQYRVAVFNSAGKKIGESEFRVK